jgi:hypothetical protein
MFNHAKNRVQVQAMRQEKSEFFWPGPVASQGSAGRVDAFNEGAFVPRLQHQDKSTELMIQSQS